MYNGIGLQTARGSGTNGYVQRNSAFIPKGRDDVKFKTEADIQRLEASANREPNQGILDHERKRKLEVKCMELEEVLEEQGYTEAEIEEKVTAYRKMLLSKEVSKKAFAEVDEFGRPVLKETHQIAEAQKEKNRQLKEAFGISSSFIEGSSFDPNRRDLEAAARDEESEDEENEADEIMMIRVKMEFGRIKWLHEQQKLKKLSLERNILQSRLQQRLAECAQERERLQQERRRLLHERGELQQKTTDWLRRQSTWPGKY